MFNNRKCALVGVVHVLPLPGSAGYDGGMDKIVKMALEDAAKYAENGIDALILENMHDAPYLKGFVEPETTAAMTMVAQAVKAANKVPCGMQLLAGANIEALGVAVAASLDFIRVEGFVYAHVGDEGIHESCAAKLIRRRAILKAENIKIFADIKKKHSAHAITSDVNLAETAHAAEFFKADGVIVTGSSTGIAPEAEDVSAARSAVSTAVLVGSGVNPENVGLFAGRSDALIVGSFFKYDGKWNNHVDPARVRKLVEATKEVERCPR